MSTLTPAMDTALAADRALVTMLIEVDLPTGTVRLMVGASALTWNGGTFVAVDPVFGTIQAVDAIEDGTGDDAPAFSFTLQPPGDAAAAQISSPAFQGSPVTVYLAALSPATGALIPDPDRLFTGLLDVPTLTADFQVREVDFECVSVFDLLLEDDEGIRLSDAWHESVWPGETGFANVTGLKRDIYWGLATPPGGSVVTTSGGGGSLIADKRALLAD